MSEDRRPSSSHWGRCIGRTEHGIDFSPPFEPDVPQREVPGITVFYYIGYVNVQNYERTFPGITRVETPESQTLMCQRLNRVTKQSDGGLSRPSIYVVSPKFIRVRVDRAELTRVTYKITDGKPCGLRTFVKDVLTPH